MLRSILLALVALAFVAPSAHAAVSDGWVPVFDASDGVTVVKDQVRFGPKAAKLYRTLAGRRYTAGCFGGTGTSGMDVGRIARKRSRIEIPLPAGEDVCFISAQLRGSDTSCVLTTTLAVGPGEPPWCARVIVALATPDEVPPAGKVGFFDDGHTRVAATRLADGTRRFVRKDGDVFSTNVEQLSRDPEVLTLY